MAVRAESGTSIEKDSSLAVNEKTIVPDTGIVKYDLNDPRNPNCPCHDAQKKADEEYRNSQMQQKQNPVDRNPVNNDRNNDVVNNDRGNNDNTGNSNSNNPDVNTNKTTFTTGSGGSQKHYSASYKFQKKMKRWSKKVNRKLHSKNKGTKGGKFRVADCFHWG
ncbi:MAG: hypothetical protein ABIQ40_06810 [Bacteroidia bacterium]